MAVLQLIFAATGDGMAKDLGLSALDGAQGELWLWLIVREEGSLATKAMADRERRESVVLKNSEGDRVWWMLWVGSGR